MSIIGEFRPMERKDFEIRTNIKFLVRLGWKGTDIIQALETVYGDHAPKKTCVYKWIARFKEGREAVEDEEGRGRPTTSRNDRNVDSVRSLVEEDGRLTVDEIAQTLEISVGSAHSILHEDLGLSKLSARWVPKALRPDQLNLRCELSTVILTKIEANEDSFFGRILTGDETWVYQYDPETKQQSKQWLPRGSAGPIKFKSERSVNKVMATVFWDQEGVVLVDFLQGRKTVTGPYYVDVLKKLRTQVAKKRPGKLHRGILFHHDNAPAHSARITKEILREFRWELLPHPPYSPDLAPSDFFLFPKLKEHLKGVRFNTTDEAKHAARTWLQNQPADFFKNGIMGWKHRLEKCIDRDGSYVEK